MQNQGITLFSLMCTYVTGEKKSTSKFGVLQVGKVYSKGETNGPGKIPGKDF